MYNPISYFNIEPYVKNTIFINYNKKKILSNQMQRLMRWMILGELDSEHLYIF